MDLATAAALATLIITGPARVIDGDTVIITDTFTSPSPIHVRLKGVDAAEMNTAIGRQSRQVMLQIVGRSDLTCYLTGEKTYKREVGYCFTSSDVDINQEIIARGAALGCARYDDRYTKYETADAVAKQTRARYCGTGKPAKSKSAPMFTEEPIPDRPGYTRVTQLLPMSVPIAPSSKPVAVDAQPLLTSSAHLVPDGMERDPVFAWVLLGMILLPAIVFPRTVGVIYLLILGGMLRGGRRW